MRKPASLLLLLSYLAFVSLGLPDTVLGVAWPSVRDGFGLTQSALGLVLAFGVSGYFVSGVIAGALSRRLGVGGLLAASSALVTLALLGFALAPSWPLFFPVGVIMGLGSGAIDSGLNGFAARHFSVRHINWLHACWGVGASIGPMIMTAAVARAGSYRVGYAALAAVLGSMMLAFFFTRRSFDAPTPAASGDGKPEERDVGTFTALGTGRIWLGMATFFFYTSLESGVGQWCFTLLYEGRGLSVENAGAWTALYWASLTVGRVALGFVVDRIGPDLLLRLATVGSVCGASLFALSDGWAGRLGLLLLGASLAPIFPTLMARTPARMGDALSRHAVGFQVSMATLGSVLGPSLIGLFVSRRGLDSITVAAVGISLSLLFVHEILLRRTPSLPASVAAAEADPSA
jgi:fucose permease